MKNLLLDILSNYGLSEIDGPLSNDEILGFFESMGYNWVTDDSTIAWCSAMMNYFAHRNGLERSGKLDARSWLKVGDVVVTPQLGDIVVFWRGSPADWRGHVGLYINEDKDYIWSLGGNVANSIAIAKYPKGRLLGYRRLKKIQ